MTISDLQATVPNVNAIMKIKIKRVQKSFFIVDIIARSASYIKDIRILIVEKAVFLHVVTVKVLRSKAAEHLQPQYHANECISSEHSDEYHQNEPLYTTSHDDIQAQSA